MQKLILLSLILFFLSIKPANAITQFATDYQIDYTVNDSGITHVKYNISQTNNLSRVYATDFSLSVSHTDIENIKVKDVDKEIDPEIILTNNLTNINFSFQNKIVGKNKTHNFTIEYDTGDIAGKTGNVWEINIPKIQAKEAINKLEINLITPADFPQAVYINPKPSKQTNNHYLFSSEILANKSISALFGGQQFFNLRVNYLLQNQTKNKAVQTIALPSNTGYQEVYIKNINPKPINISTDPDGNWLAEYRLEPQQNLTIFLEEIIKLNFKPSPETAAIDLDRFLKPTAVWDFNSSAFQKINENLKTAKEIFDFSVTSLVYNYSLVNKDPLNRQPASSVLEHPTQAICTDFTDLFIALARKRGIPAREIQGFAFSQNDKLKPLSLAKDILHAWPEYYDKNNNTWTQIDPTWTNTTNGIDYFNKLDLNHIAFVTHGEDPTFPLPASKNVSLKVTSPFQFPAANINAALKDQKGNNLLVEITNSSGLGFKSNISLVVSGTQKQSIIAHIPPLSRQEINFNLQTRPVFGLTTKVVTININNQQFNLPLKIEPIIQTKLLVVFLLGLIVLLILIIKKVKKTNSVFPVSIKT